MARVTLKRAVEAKIRKKMHQNNAGILWLLQDFRSPEEGLARLSTGGNSTATGRSIRRCIEAAKTGPHTAEAIDLIVWIHTDNISRYCSNVGGWYRRDAEQEGLLAIIETAQHFSTFCVGERYISEAFRKAVIRHVRAVRKKESRHAKISEELLAFIDLGFQMGDTAAKSQNSAKPVELHEHDDTIALLRKTVDAATLDGGLESWALRHLYGQSIAKHVRQNGDTDELMKATTKMQRRVLRLHRRLRKIFQNHGLQMVAIESLWLAGKACNDSVAMVSLRAANADEVRQDCWTIEKA